MKTIQLNHLEISQDQVIIIGNSTAFANETRMEFVEPEALATKLSATLKIARSKGISVLNQKATREAIAILALTTPAKIEQYNALFDQCIEFWTPRVNLEAKTIPDYIYDECKVGYEIRNQMMAMFHRQRPLDMLREITCRINELENAVSRECTNSTLTFSL
ncbi:hypothetical protein OTK49_28445 [Vibrio coralliirubri]|uniref:hypothetical protein n=1 Tax=Vibrio coralliirubri TaxID=1516159 RepID=UPI002283558A|nr:hypothetical protein [Vibrio coralliirubri]MCY9866474.1 hypothetical protein [Vibrio coralliirubri]